MKKLFSTFILALAMSIFVMPASQAAVFKAGENLLIPEKILNDAYLVASNGSVDADIMNDLYIAGGQVTINSNVGQDLVVTGGRVVVMGDVIGDIRILGGQVSIYGKVGEDVLVAGGQVEVGKKAFVNGNMYVASGSALDGQIKGELKGFANIYFQWNSGKGYECYYGGSVCY
jgi:UDP-3-O-[3-hydroxymyristoyl] glucosamine N-acyltransferase